MNNIDKLSASIRDIPDFPKKGIIFKDITPLLQDGELFSIAVEEMASPFKGKEIDSVVAIEARGFILGGAIAKVLGCGFVPVRKAGKLPYETDSVTYELEYGTDTLEVHTDSVKKGDKVLIIDDLLATGGTAKGVSELVEKSGGEVVAFSFLVELSFLNGRDKLKNYPVHALIKY